MRETILSTSATRKQNSRTNRSMLLASIAAMTVASQFAKAASSTVQMTASDGFGASSFNTGVNWGVGSLAGSPAAGVPPVAGTSPDTNDYFVVGLRQMRTPTSGSGITFAGDSLTLMDGGTFFTKGPSGAIYTVNNFTLDGGQLGGSSNNPYTLNGNINVTGNGGVVWLTNAGNTFATINSTISGVGSLNIGSSQGAAALGSTNTLTGNNSYQGATNLLGGKLILGSSNALPSSSVITMGSITQFAANGNGVLDLNGLNISAAGLQVSSFSTSSATGSVLSSFSTINALVHLNSIPANLAVGQKITSGSQSGWILNIDRTRNNILVAQGGTSITSGSTFNFTNDAVTAASQIVGNGSTTADATLTIKGPNSTTFGGTIQNVLASGTRTTGVTVSGGSFTLTGSNTYTGNTSVNGGTLRLNFNTATSPTNHIINNTGNNSVLVLNGGTLSINGSSGAANLQRFNNTTLSGGTSVQVARNGFDVALNLNAINRVAGGAIDFTNPSGTLSATNGIQTTSGAASSLITDVDGVPYASVGGTTWAAKDSTNAWIEGLAGGSYTSSTSSTLSGNADVSAGTDTTLTGNTSITTLRFNQVESRTINAGSNTLTVGGILNSSTNGANASTISNGSINGIAGKELVVLQNNTAGNLVISANIVDNTSATAFTSAGNGTVVLSGSNTYTGATYASAGTLKITSQNALYNNTPSSWTASNIVVGTSAALELNVGGAGEFTTSDLATIAALGTTTGGFKSGSTLGIDTSNAGGSFTHSSAITNTNGGVNELNLKKIGTGTLVLNAAETYTGSTTINGGTLQLGGSGSLSSSTRVTSNGGTFDINGKFQTVAALSGSGTVAIGSGNLTVSGNNSGTFSGNVTGTGGLTVNGNATLNLTGSQNYTGTTSVRTGTLSLSTSSSSTIGDSTHPVLVANGNADTAILNIASGVTLNAGTAVGVTGMFVGANDNSTSGGGNGTVNQTGGIVNANQLTLGGGSLTANGATGVYNLSGGSINMSGDLRLAFNQNSTGILNISNGNVNLQSNSNIVSGQFFGRPGTIVQTGGSVTFYSDAGTTIGGTGAINFGGTSSASAYTLSGGTLTVPSITRTAASGTPSINFNGGTIRPAVNNPAQFISTSVTTRVQSGGAIIDTNSNDLTMNNVFIHDAALGGTADGGLTKAGAGTLTLSGASTYTGNTNINGGTLAIGSGGSITTSPQIAVGTGTTFDVSAVAPYSLTGTQVLRGTGTVVGAINHTTGTITGATVGTGGVLTFSSSLNLTGGTTRFDLDTTSASSNNDRVDSNGGLTISGPSLINVQFATLPSSAQTYTLFNYTGSLTGATSDFILGGNAGGRSVTLNFATPGQVKLTFTPGGAAANMIWKSNSSQAWDIQTTANWKNTTQAIASDVYYNGDNINLLDNSIDASVPTNVQTAITLNAVAAPASITVNSNIKDYTVSGTGKISGSTGITKNGTNTLTLATANDFTGTTNINAGKIIVTDVSASPSTSGLGTGTVNIAAAGTLQIGDGTTSGAGSVTGNVNNSGVLIFNRPDNVTLNTNVSGTGAFTKQAAGTLTLSKTKQTYSGATNINGGTITATVANDLPDQTVYNIGDIAGATLDLGGLTQTVKAISGGGTTGGAVTIGGGTLIIGGGTTATFAGTVSGNAVQVTSGSIQSFTGDPSWTGSTVVNTGTLSVSSTTGTSILGSLSSAIQVGGGTGDTGVLNIGTGMTVGSSGIQVGRSLAQGLNGNGTINQTAGLVVAAQMFLGGTSTVPGGGSGTYNLSGGELHVAGAFELAWNQNSTGLLNVSGGHLYVGFDNDIRLGRFFARPGIVAQTGGIVTFTSDENSTIGTVGGVILGGGSTGGSYGYNLNGGVLQMAGAKVDNAADRSGAFHFGGGTLQAQMDNSDYFPQGGGGGWSVNIGAGGGTVDTNGFNVAINQAVAHDTTLGSTPDGGLTKTGSGTLTLNTAPTYTGNTTVNNGKLHITSGAIQGSGNMTITNGASVEVNANGSSTGVIVIKNLTTTGAGSHIEIHDNDMVLDYGVNPSTYTSVVSKVMSGLTLLSGAGTDGITSAEVDAQTLTGTVLAVVDDGDPNIAGGITSISGFTIPNPTQSVLVKYTWFGDANLDGIVDGSDYALTDTGFTSGGLLGGWVFGDYDYNGNVDGGDYALQDTGFIAQTGALPEPATLGLLGLGAMGMLRRRRKA